MLAEPAGVTPSTVSLSQPVVPTGRAADDVPPSHLSLMSNQLSEICVVPVAAVPRAHTSLCHFWPGCTGVIGASRSDGRPEALVPVLVKLTDHLPVRTVDCVFTPTPSSGR